MRGMSGSGPLGVEAQMDWFGQPAQALPWPARVDSGPGQCSGSGAMRGGVFFRGAERSTWIGGSSEGAIVEEGRRKGRHMKNGVLEKRDGNVSSSCWDEDR